MPKPPRPSASEVLRHNLLILVGLPSLTWQVLRLLIFHRYFLHPPYCAYREVACPQSIVLIERVILFFSRAPDIMTPIPVGHPAFINFTGKVNLVDLKMEFGKFL